MNNDQFLQYYLEKQAARGLRAAANRRQRGKVPKAVRLQDSRTREAFNGGRPRNNPTSPQPEVKPTGTAAPSRKWPTINQSPAVPEVGSAGRSYSQSSPGIEGTPGRPNGPVYSGREGGTPGTPSKPVNSGVEGTPGRPDSPVYPGRPTGPGVSVPPRRKYNWPLIIGGAAAGTTALGAAGYGAYKMTSSGEDAAPAPATTAKTTDPNAAPEANTPKQEDNESWWADVLAWIKENPELAMLVLGGGGLGIGALLGSR